MVGALSYNYKPPSSVTSPDCDGQDGNMDMLHLVRNLFFFGNFPLVLSQLACRINLIYSYILLSRVIATLTQEAASLMMLAKISTTAMW